MRALIQRVSKASVQVEDREISRIGPGILLLLGVATGDHEGSMEKLLKKCLALRMFEDDAGKMNLSLKESGGELLVVSQFTLCADLKKGNRPSFTSAAEPSVAERLYEEFVKRASEELKAPVATGSFGAHMKVSLQNDGPVTFLLDTETL